MMRRFVIGLGVLVALAACGGDTSNNAAVNPGSGGGTSSSKSGSDGQTVDFKETEYTLAPATLTLKPGTYTFKIQNVGQFPHDLHVAASSDGTEVGGSTVITAGQTGSFTITLKAGAYTLWCAVDAHRSLGMVGQLTVQ
jgi:plastocyanin